MQFESIDNHVDRWFAETSSKMMYVSIRDLDDALAEQENLERTQRRTVRIWEVLVLLGRLTVEQVDHILETLGKEGSKKSDISVSMLGRVLVEVGYASYEDVTSALQAQVAERKQGTWRMLGQILVDRNVILQRHLQEALEVLDQRRRLRNTPNTEEHDAEEEDVEQ